MNTTSATSPTGHDDQGLMTRKQALALILDQIRRLDSEPISPWKAMFRVLALGVDCPVDLPDHPRSVRDGYTLSSQETAKASGKKPVLLQSVRVIRAHDHAGPPLEPGQAARVLTGARLPENCDSVVMEEDVLFDGKNIQIESPAPPGMHVKPAGAFMKQGDRILEPGAIIQPPASAAMVRAGIEAVDAHRRIRANILSLGDELTNPFESWIDREAGPDLKDQDPRIPADNLILLEGLMRRFGAGSVRAALRGDDLDAVAEFLAEHPADLTVTAGGTGNSEKDVTLRAAQKAGYNIFFNRVAVSPGRGIFFGMKGDSVLFGLPGPPSAVFAAFHSLVLPALFKLRGLSAHQPVEAEAILSRPARPGKGGERLVCCGLTRENGTLIADPLGKDETGALSAMIRAKGLLVCPAGMQMLAEGERATVLPFPGPDGYDFGGPW